MSTLYTVLCSASSMFQSENASRVVLVDCVSWHLIQYLVIPGTEQVLPSLTQQKSFQESNVDFVYSSSLFTVLLCSASSTSFMFIMPLGLWQSENALLDVLIDSAI